MSLTLGEKLRQAREAGGITISEVAEQTRIAPLYLECIENNDYRTLPGGIFNKGFVKSFAKYVGVDEQEALQDYANLLSNQDQQIVEEPKTYRSQVLTDDRSSSSMLPTIVFAVIILGLMTWGILTLVNYIQQNPDQLASENATNTNANLANANSTSDSNSLNTDIAPTQDSLSLSGTKIEFKSLKQPASLTSTMDGARTSAMVTPDNPRVFEPKQNLRLVYSKSQTQNVQMTINGKQISLPSKPLDTKRSVIELDITNENIKQIWESGAIPFENATQTVTSPTATPRTAPLPRTTPKPSASASATPKTSPSPSATSKPTASPRATPKN
jgi:cytoskeletal protein RodZ